MRLQSIGTQTRHLLTGKFAHNNIVRQNTLQRRSVSLTQIWNEHQRELEREKERAASGKKTARSVPHGIEQEGPVVFPWRTLMYGSLVVLFNGACLFGAYLYFAMGDEEKQKLQDEVDRRNKTFTTGVISPSAEWLGKLLKPPVQLINKWSSNFIRSLYETVPTLQSADVREISDAEVEEQMGKVTGQSAKQFRERIATQIATTREHNSNKKNA